MIYMAVGKVLLDTIAPCMFGLTKRVTSGFSIWFVLRRYVCSEVIPISAFLDTKPIIVMGEAKGWSLNYPVLGYFHYLGEWDAIL